MKRMIGYIRVSTTEQVNEGLSLEMQTEKIRGYAALNNYELLDIRCDAGISAKNIKGRPGFQDALKDVLSCKADGLIVWKLDRAFRSTQDALNTAQKLAKKGKEFHSISEKLDTSSAIGEFFFTLMASLAQMEHKMIGERTKAALDIKRARGEKTGGQVPYGKDEENGLLVDNALEQVVIKQMKAYRAKGMTIRKIVEQLKEDGFVSRTGGEFNVRLVHRIVTGA